MEPCNSPSSGRTGVDVSQLSQYVVVTEVIRHRFTIYLYRRNQVNMRFYKVHCCGLVLIYFGIVVAVLNVLNKMLDIYVLSVYLVPDLQMAGLLPTVSCN